MGQRLSTAGMLLCMCLAIGVGGCGGSSDGSGSASGSKPGNVLGTYENANEGMTLELQSGGKAVMSEGDGPHSMTWEMDGSDKVVVHGMDGISLVFNINSDGNLSDGIGAIFRKK